MSNQGSRSNIPIRHLTKSEYMTSKNIPSVKPVNVIPYLEPASMHLLNP